MRSERFCRPWAQCPPQSCEVQACQCGACRGGACVPLGSRGYLLPRIVACGREWLRCLQTRLQVEGVSECAQEPLRLIHVCVAGDAAWTQQMDHARRQMQLHVCIPLQCQVEDGCGRTYCGHAWVEVESVLRLPMQPGECWRNSLMILPCVRLISAACGNGCFDAQLEVHLESYMVRWEPCMSPQMGEVCPPPLPLYPQMRC